MFSRLHSIWRKGLPPGSLAAFGFALLCFIGAASIRGALASFAQDVSPFRAYFLAILIATMVGGKRAGILFLILGLFAGWDGLQYPLFSLHPLDMPQTVDIAFYVLTSLAIIAVSEAYRRMLRPKSGHEETAEPLIEQIFGHLEGALAPKESQTRAAAKVGKSALPTPAASDLIARYSKELFDTFSPLIPLDRPVALIDFPDSANCGDHAIWLGEKVLLSQLGITPAYECATYNYNREEMAARLGSGTILMHGGGNFGDRYEVYHEFRLQVLSDFPNNKAIVFPQQLTFLDNANLRRTAEALAQHPNLTLFARGVMTQHTMEQYFGATANIRLAPDMAFMMGRQAPIGDPLYDILWLSRTDQEKATGRDVEPLLGLSVAAEEDFRLPPFADGVALNLIGKSKARSALMTDWYGLHAADGGDAIALQRMAFDAKSTLYVDRARFILSLGHIAITDRLHGHILCLLMGKPHIFLNNDSGKNWNFYDTWTRDTPLCRLARNPEEALALAMAAMPKAKTLGPMNMEN